MAVEEEMKSVKATKLKKILKARGLGNYSTRAIKNLSSKKIDRYLWALSLKKGDVIYDCDGFNHRIREEWFECWHQYYDHSPCLQIIFQTEEGYQTCGCSYGPYPAQPVQQVIKDKLYPQKLIDEWKKHGWWNKHYQKRRDAIKNGEPIVDSEGILLSSFRI